MSEHIVNVSAKEYNGRKYRSTLEAETAETLDKMGIPFAYENRKIEIFPGFRCQYQKDKVQAICYKPDFEIGPIIIETKGYETPDWKLKRKLLFKFLQENEPNTIFYQVKTQKQLLEALDPHWNYLGYAIQVRPKPKKVKGTVQSGSTTLYDSVSQAMHDLHLKGKAMGSILRSLTGKTEYVFGYNWKLIKLKL